MEGRGSGSLFATSVTATVHGDTWHMVCQSLNAEFAKKNVHISHVGIDGPVDAPDTLGKMM
eukprot:10401019-Ditylum_brightwellii.AAC.1